MEELLMTIETEIALATKHLSEDEGRINDPILGQFFRGRATIEKQTLAILRKLSDIANRI